MASCYLPASEQAEVETAESKVTYSVPAGSTALLGAAASAPSTHASPAWVSLTDLNHETQNHAHEAISIPNREKEGTLGEVASFVRLGGCRQC
ncbi:hypothetical protein Acr_00g0002430 [Actinidia rufa]|uniref:Uncharacterized protein n=1 Tax=Actinidia rufa TaxID=165716 RepID=A0A7J0D8P0_9ERIC|nr:hypothetical protein Acr_00g0002350 [Actinidia rufa]GFS28542.1 hypothetical protein Acr_00g0002430 [Actinidia rufa]